MPNTPTALNPMSTQMFQVDRTTMERLVWLQKQTHLTQSEIVRAAINAVAARWEADHKSKAEQASVSVETVEQEQ